MARIKGVSQREAGPFARLVFRIAKSQLGKVPEPLTIAARHPWIFRGTTAYEYAFQRAKHVSPRLKALALVKAAALIGCPF